MNKKSYLKTFLVGFMMMLGINVSAKIKVGVAETIITPPNPVGQAIAGYDRGKNTSTGTHDDLFARSIVVEGKYGTLVAMITVAGRARLYYGSVAALEILAPWVLGHRMIFLRSATQFLELEADPDIQRLADRCVEAIMKYHFNPQYGLTNENIKHDLSRPDHDMAKFFYLGHGCETLWMVMAEAVCPKDAELFNRAAEVFKSSVEVATDAVEGGHFRPLDNVDTHTFKVDKVTWLQEEILIGTMMLMVHTQEDEWARERFAQTYT